MSRDGFLTNEVLGLEPLRCARCGRKSLLVVCRECEEASDPRQPFKAEGQLWNGLPLRYWGGRKRTSQ